MTLLGGQDTGLGNVDTAAQPAEESAGGITEITSPDSSVTVSNPSGPVVQLEVPAAKVPGSAISGLAFPVVAGTPTLTATEPVTLPVGLGVEGSGVEVVTGTLSADAGVPTILHSTLEVDGTTTLNGALQANNGAAIVGGANVQGGVEVVTGDLIADAGVPTTLHGTLEVDGAGTFNGAVALNNGGTIEAQPIAAQILANTVNLASVPLSGISAAGLTVGALAWVASVGAWFRLQIGALAVDHLTVETASGLAGAQWVRLNLRNPVWEAQTTWAVNTATGSDEAAGTSGAPLKTLSETSRRLAYATLTGTTVTAHGNVAASDLANWTFICKTAFGFQLIFTPTLLYSGTITTATNAAPAPTTTENDLRDTGITGGSFTAAGLLATGVMFKRTSDSAIWWAAKDKGTQTIRISQANVGFADTALANGDAYTASQLSSIQQMTFSETAAFSVSIQNALLGTFYDAPETCLFFQNCWLQSPEMGPGYLYNCCLSGGGALQGATNEASGGFVNSGLWLGTGSSQVTSTSQNLEIGPGRLTLQGMQVSWQRAFSLIICDILSYDCTTYPLQAAYWGVVLWSTGAFGGSNNAELAEALKLSHFAHTTTPLWLAGSSTDAVGPISVAGTGTMTVAAESGGAGALNAQANGIFPTS
jgi:hypothetical protein